MDPATRSKGGLARSIQQHNLYRQDIGTERPKRSCVDREKPGIRRDIGGRDVEKHHKCHRDLTFDAMSQPVPGWCDGYGEHRAIDRQHESFERHAFDGRSRDVHTGSNDRVKITSVFYRNI